MLEDVKTIDKSIKMIEELAGKVDAQSQNQLVRWVINKENHAQDIITTISDYFLTQRVKPSQEDYLLRLENHHKVIIGAMEVKQKVDVDLANNLRESINALQEYYPEHMH
jgi:nickel superoxide dismutase